VVGITGAAGPLMGDWSYKLTHVLGVFLVIGSPETAFMSCFTSNAKSTIYKISKLYKNYNVVHSVH